MSSRLDWVLYARDLNSIWKNVAIGKKKSRQIWFTLFRWKYFSQWFQSGGKLCSWTAIASPRWRLHSRQWLVLQVILLYSFFLIVGPTGCRPYCGFLLLLLLHHHPAVSRLSINSHIQAISASPPTYHTSPERDQRLGSSGDDKDDDKDTHKDKYKDKDRAFKTRRKSSCIYKFSYSA